jgi:hypothetical protein
VSILDGSHRAGRVSGNVDLGKSEQLPGPETSGGFPLAGSELATLSSSGKSTTN